jgi:5-methylthioribose kinase
MIAHMMMAQQDRILIQRILSYYHPPFGFSQPLLAGFTGIEILRRILGVAQLPLSLSLDEKKDLMQIASGWILNGKMDIW